MAPAPDETPGWGVALPAVALPFAFAVNGEVVPVGTFPEIAPVNILLHALSGWLALALAFRLNRGDARVAEAVRHPVVLAAAALGALGLVLAPFHPYPDLSILGHPEHGIGALWHLELAVWIAGFRVLHGTGWWPRAVAAVVVAVALAAVGELTGYFVAFRFPDHFTDLGLFALAGVVATGKDLPGPWRCVGLLAAIAVGLDATGRVGHGLLLLIGLYALLHGWRPAWTARLAGLPRRSLGGVVAAVAVLATVGLYAAAPVFEDLAASYQAAERPGGTPEPASTAPRDAVNLKAGWHGTLWNRGQFLRLVEAAFRDDPWAMVTGRGFGMFPETQARFAREVPGRLYDYAPDQYRAGERTRWPRDKGDIHSHNRFVEAWHAVGVGGLLLTLFLAAAPVVYAARDRWHAGLLLSFVLVGLGSTWFFLPPAGPFLAFAMAAVLPGPSGESRPWRGFRPAATGALVLLGLGGIGAALATGAAAGQAKVLQVLGAERPVAKGDCRLTVGPFREPWHDLGLYRGGLKTLADLAGAPGADGPPTEALNSLPPYVCTMDRYLETPGAPLEVRAFALDTKRRLWHWTDGHPALREALAPTWQDWDDHVRLFLDAAPERTDPAIPLLRHHMDRGNRDALIRWAKRLKRRAPADPVTLWARGMVHYKIGPPEAEPKAMRLLNQALDKGFANLAPVSKDFVETVRGKQGAKKGET